MKNYKKALGILLCLLLLSSCTPAEPGSSNSPGTPSPADTAPGGEAQPTKAPNYLSDPKFDTKDPLPQYDHDNSWTHPLGSSTNCATEDTLYFELTDGKYRYIGYADLATGISGPLCGKPECLHNDEQCNAYLRLNYPGGWSVYDGKLYWIDLDENGNPAIFCMNLDATGRTAVCSLDASWFKRINGSITVAFHRGYAIITGRGKSVAGAAASQGVMVYAVSLATGEATAIMEQFVGAEVVSDIIAVPYRDTLYLVYTEFTNGQRRMDISTWSLKTHETALLYSQAAEFGLREIWPTEDGLMLSAYGDIYKFDPITKELSLLFSVSADIAEPMPEFANGYVIDWTPNETGIPHVFITDLAGNSVYSETLDLPDWPSQGFSYALMGADNGNLYVELQYRIKDDLSGRQSLKTAITQIPLDGGGTVRELWSGELPL